jgi:hypothetical protein
MSSDAVALRDLKLPLLRSGNDEMGHVDTLNSHLHDAKEGFCEYGDTVSGSIEARNLINSF